MSGLRWRVLTQSQSTMRKDSECAAPWNFTVGHRKRINEAHMSRHFASVRSDSCGTPGAAEHRAERSAAGQRRLEASARGSLRRECPSSASPAANRANACQPPLAQTYRGLPDDLSIRNGSTSSPLMKTPTTLVLWTSPMGTSKGFRSVTIMSAHNPASIAPSAIRLPA
jgi:hypothetical protein